MAEHLNEKYGYHLTAADCTYFREEDYSYHPAFLYGTTYDVPYIGIFQKDGKYITVTDREGLFGDDHQLEELNVLLCDYFGDLLGTRPVFVEVRLASNGNIKDVVLNRLLHYFFTEKLTAGNIEQFVEYFWTVDRLEMIFYYSAEEDLDAQLLRITKELDPLSKHSKLVSLRFYITDMKHLIIHYYTPRVHLQSGDESEQESDAGYVWGHYHVVNDVEHYYPSGGNTYYDGLKFNSFLAGGAELLDRGYSPGFGNREKKKIRTFAVVDLSDHKLQEYLEDMVSYGQFRGYTILFQTVDDAEVDTLTIAEGDKYRWDFKWGSGEVQIYAFKHGRLFDLETAFNCGYLSPEDMDAILQKHKEHFATVHDWDYDAP